MSAIFPKFISPDRQQWVISLNTESSACYICSSTELRDAINQKLQDNNASDASAMHFKEAADMIINAVKKSTGQELEVITFTDGNGKFLTISKTSCEHNFDPTPEAVSEPDTKTASHKPLDKSLLKRRAEIRARLQKLADQCDD